MSDIILKEIKRLLIVIMLLNILVIITSIFLKIFEINVIIGSIFGSLFVILNFVLWINILSKSLSKDPYKAKSFIFVHYFIKYILTAIFIFISIKSEYINSLSSIIMLFAPKISFYIFEILNKK